MEWNKERRQKKIRLPSTGAATPANLNTIHLIRSKKQNKKEKKIKSK